MISQYVRDIVQQGVPTLMLKRPEQASMQSLLIPDYGHLEELLCDLYGHIPEKNNYFLFANVL